MTDTNAPPLITIVGPTASGKSALALELAKRFDGEIIAADSRTIYKGMDIGTAKPTAQERREIAHHLIDVVAPSQSFTVADFQKMALAAIDGISSRGKLPLLVGGSGLYIDAVLYSFGFRGASDPQQRDRLRALSVDQLQTLLEEKGIDLPENKDNPRHLVRSLETGGAAPTREGLRPNTLVLGLDKDRAELETLIRDRVERMVSEGFEDEVRELSQRYGWDTPALQAPGYRAFRMYLAGQCSLSEAKDLFVRYDLQYAKRQKTWFRRNKDIIWISKSEDAVDLVTTFLNK